VNRNAADDSSVAGPAAGAVVVLETAVLSLLTRQASRRAKRTSWVAEAPAGYQKLTSRRKCVIDPEHDDESWLEAGWPQTPPTCVVLLVEVNSRNAARHVLRGL